MASEPKTHTKVESVYLSKDEKETAAILRMKVAQLICKNPDKTGLKYIIKN